jgi:hypothetical protein
MVLVWVLLSTLPSLGNASHFATAPANAGSHSRSLLAPAAGGAAVPAASHPLAGVTGTFYQNTTGFATVPSANVSCASYECFIQAQEPSLLPLKNSNISVSYSILSKATQTCPAGELNATGNTSVRVAYSLSSNNGNSFGGPTYFPISCPFVQQLEPSFAVSRTGTVYGTFVEGNASQLGVLGYGTPVIDYTSRPSDALVFTNSTNNATSFSTPKIIAVAGGANIARPSLAAFGSTVYIAYENIVNGSSTLPGTTVAPIAVEFVYSSDAGVTWHGPYTLPGLNASQFNNSISPAVTVTPTGTVAVSYATNRHCIAYCGATFNTEYGDDIVVATSGSNGTSWSGPYVVAHNTGNGESGYYNGNYNYGSSFLFEDAPLTAIAYNAISSSLDVVWVGAINLTKDYYYDQWYSTQAFAATSSNGGVSWANATIGRGLPNDQNTFAVGYFNPGVSISPTGYEYVSLGWYNQSGQSCGASSATYYSSGYTQWITTSPDGIHFSDLISATVAENAGGYANYLGFRSAVAFNATGSPLIGYALPSGYTFSPQYTLTGELVVAQPYVGPTVTVQGIVGNLGPGASWAFMIDGNIFSSLQRSINVTNVPTASQVVIIQGPSALIPNGFWSAQSATQSGPRATTLVANVTYWFNYTEVYGLNFNIEPKDIPYFYLDIFNYSGSAPESCYYYWESGKGYYYNGGNPFPWYFPAGTHLDIGQQYTYPVGQYYYSYIGIYYFNGTGNGNFTGAGSTAHIVMNGPINETAWAQSDSTFNVTVAPQGLPSSSTYSFAWDGAVHSAAGTTSVVLPNVGMGAHWVTSATATSAQAGWKYFGGPELGDPIAIPENPVVNLTFAYVHVAAASGKISFHATGLVPGSVWHLSFNGTEYSSATAWINVTGHPGTYPVHSYPVVASDGSAGYAPNAFGPRINVTTGNTYPVTFSAAYALTVSSSAGGHIVPAPSTSWLLPGTHVTYNATANPGYRFVGWSGIGNGSFTGTTAIATVTVNGAIQESASFAPLPGNRFNVTFTESALPAGTWWTVYVGGVGYSSNTSTLTVSNLNACSQTRYSLAVPYAYGSSLDRYAPVGAPATVCAGSPVPISFAAQYYVTLETTAGGTVSVTSTGGSYSASFWLAASDSGTFLATPISSGFQFLGWNGSGTGSFSGATNPRTTSIGGPITELAVFAPVLPKVASKYSVTFVDTTAFVPGTAWSVGVGGTVYSSTGATLTVSNLAAGPYSINVQGALSPDGRTQYQPVGPPTKITVSSNVTGLNLTYRTSYWVAVSALGGGSASPHGGWYAAGSNLALAAVSQGASVFKGWSGTGTGAYTGPNAFQNVTVNAPISEVATFAPPAPASTTITSSWSSTALWAELGIAGLVIGLIIGIVAMRMRRGGGPSPPPEMAPATGPEPAADDPDSGGSA